jgi:hypothetical protein
VPHEEGADPCPTRRIEHARDFRHDRLRIFELLQNADLHVVNHQCETLGIANLV